MSPPSTVHVDLSDVRRLPVLGQMTWTPKRRLVAADHVVLPTPVVVGSFGALLVPYDIALTPTDDPRYAGPWCYQVVEPGGTVRHVLVATTAPGVVVAYPALVEVDPASLAVAAAPPPPAWDARVSQLEARVASFAEATGAAPASFVHVQTTPASTWAVAHPLGRLPGVEVYLGGRPVATDVEASTTHAYITWREPTAGTVVLT